MFTHREHSLNHAARYSILFNTTRLFKNNFKTKSNKKYTPQRTKLVIFLKHFLGVGECMPPNNLCMRAAIMLLFLYRNVYFYAKFKTLQRNASVVTCF